MEPRPEHKIGLAAGASRASSVQSPSAKSCSAPTSGRAQNASCFSFLERGSCFGFQRVAGAKPPQGAGEFTPTDSPANSPDEPMTHLRVNCGETVDSNGVIGAAPILCRQIRTEIAGEPTSR